jgi:hypothetical protein
MIDEIKEIKENIETKIIENIEIKKEEKLIEPE